MTPKFSKAVDPIFLYVLDLMERLENDADSVNPSDERVRILKRIDSAENLLGQTPDWELAKYAISGWIDQLLITAPWSGGNWWKNNNLEFGYFRSGTAYTNFYTQAKQAQALSGKDALEVYYLCVVMGFRGLYGDVNSLQYAQQLGLPADLETWAKQTAASLQLGQGRSPILERPKPGDGAPPLNGHNKLVNMSLFAVVMLALCCSGYYIYFGNS
ncbi:MAG: type IV secretion protein DotU [Blastopirellula sp.]|nr:MAG: type IV secretion protein DotU [Blastopirellula sp.]